MKVPPKDAMDDKPDPELIALGKKAGNDFFPCTMDEVERGPRKIDFAIALILDPQSSQTPPNQLVASLSLAGKRTFISYLLAKSGIGLM